jgi:hypothetical protein
MDVLAESVETGSAVKSAEGESVKTASEETLAVCVWVKTASEETLAVCVWVATAGSLGTEAPLGEMAVLAESVALGNELEVAQWVCEAHAVGVPPALPESEGEGDAEVPEEEVDSTSSLIIWLIWLPGDSWVDSTHKLKESLLTMKISLILAHLVRRDPSGRSREPSLLQSLSSPLKSELVKLPSYLLKYSTRLSGPGSMDAMLRLVPSRTLPSKA